MILIRVRFRARREFDPESGKIEKPAKDGGGCWFLARGLGSG